MIKENLGEIFRGGKPCLVRKSQNNTPSEPKYKSISFGTPVPSSWPKGLRYDVDYYGELDNKELVAHVLHHVKLIPQYHKEGPICMCLTVPWAMDSKVVEDMLKKTGLDNKGEETIPVIVYEMDHDTKGYSYLYEDSKL